ncbi:MULTISPECIES: pyruvate kinase [unclassified Halorhodospira]|uniref:pyruvate kinase n=1 Tax=unclassified Halorhodospira TaxID=2626748 RepID=UPI001EE88AFF|nr:MULTISPECIES: pyruvate kinase [unclassified Halorhodospira]MCG5540033.1 pyruvate kinase [Halorhodospira sp. M39old]MCG5544841.1 pyruvate kinase [Halorhodospira sp. M38]
MNEKTGFDGSVWQPEALLDVLEALRWDIEEGAERWLRRYEDAFPDGVTTSAENFAHYLALRNRDLRSVQRSLARFGLSSLGRHEPHVLAGLNEVIEALGARVGRVTQRRRGGPTFEQAHLRLATHAADLLGPVPEGRDSRVMVTLPSAAADDPDLVRSLVASGMDMARINCAHDDPAMWRRMARHVRDAEARTGRSCRVHMDLAGHKVRTGPVAPRTPVVRLKPMRDAYGRAVRRAQVDLVHPEQTGDTGRGGVPRLCLDGETLASMRVGDRLRFRDARKSSRLLAVREAIPGGFRADIGSTAYVTPRTRFALQRRGAGKWQTVIRGLRCGGFAEAQMEIRLFEGDTLVLLRRPEPGTPGRRDEDGGMVVPARIACSHPQVIDQLGPGQAVWIDDGKIGAEVECVDAHGARLRITRSRPQGAVLHEDKGLNFPGLDLGLPALSARDEQDLDFVAELADTVALSFTESRSDLEALGAALARRGAVDLGVIAKIETQRGVQNLPDILLGGMGRFDLGVMIARGDLAVEIGGERLAEVQEELLWLCEAAHVPVIWATQVLESLAKKGIASRPELTDAAMSGRAECVMLNKGPYIVTALRTLDGILHRMQQHQRKKTPRLRALGIVQNQPAPQPAADE